MKFLLMISFVFSITTTTFAQTTSCEQTYLDAALKKNESVLDSFMGPITIAPTIVLGIVNPALGASYLVLSNIAAYKITQNRAEISVEDLLHSTETRRFRRILRKSKKINESTTANDISRIIENGFISGDFCASDKLATPRQISKYVLEQIK